MLGKYNNVTWKANSSTEADDSIFDFSLDADENFDYWLGVIGVNFWFTDGFGLNVNGKKFFVDNASEDGNKFIPSVHMLYRY